MKIQKTEGFTLVEILVAMVVLAVGLLGMAAMTVMVVRGNKGASDLTAATNICNLKMEQLKDAGYVNLGSVESRGETNEANYGLSNALIYTEQVDRDGVQTETGRYYRNFVICKGTDYDAATSQVLTSLDPYPGTVAASSPDLKCSVNDTNRSEEVACLQTDIQTPGETSNERKIKILCTWRSSDGMCHGIDLGSTVINFAN